MSHAQLASVLSQYFTENLNEEQLKTLYLELLNIEFPLKAYRIRREILALKDRRERLNSRKKGKGTQLAIAKEIGVTAVTLRYYEYNDYLPLTLEQLLTLMQYFEQEGV